MGPVALATASDHSRALVRQRFWDDAGRHVIARVEAAATPLPLRNRIHLRERARQRSSAGCPGTAGCLLERAARMSWRQAGWRGDPPADSAAATSL